MEISIRHDQMITGRQASRWQNIIQGEDMSGTKCNWHKYVTPGLYFAFYQRPFSARLFLIFGFIRPFLSNSDSDF